MPLFRDEKEALRRLEEALAEDEAYEDEAYEEYEDEEAYEDGEYEEEDSLEGVTPDVSRISVRNTDRTDVDPEEYTERLHKPRRGFCGVIAILLGIAALFLLLTWVVGRYL